MQFFHGHSPHHARHLGLYQVRILYPNFISNLLINQILKHFIFIFRYSGELREVGVQLDKLATLLWENVNIFSFYVYVKLCLYYLSMKLSDVWLFISTI